jgi:nicotinate phosphoribosyltransferase
VRLDSGDLLALSKSVRRILDDGGLKDTTIFASGGLDEDDLLAFARAEAPIDGYGIGTSLTTSSDVPAIDSVYKLEEYAGVPRRKLSIGKATWPGRKQVWRSFGPDGRMIGDVLSTADDQQQGEPLLHLVMKEGKRVGPPESLKAIRQRAAHDLARLPEPLRRLDPGGTYPVRVADGLVELAAEFDQRLARSKERPQ